jgi:hypothetical protein
MTDQATKLRLIGAIRALASELQTDPNGKVAAEAIIAALRKRGDTGQAEELERLVIRIRARRSAA